jgi:hypothetical protein
LKKVCVIFSLDRYYGNRRMNILRGPVDITDVENPVDNVEKPAVPRKMPVENPVEKVDKKLHRG